MIGTAALIDARDLKILDRVDDLSRWHNSTSPYEYSLVGFARFLPKFERKPLQESGSRDFSSDWLDLNLD